MPNRDTHKKTMKSAMIEALKKTMGVVTHACKIAGISRETHFRWLREDEEYGKQVDATADIAIDFAESALHKQITNGNITAIIFYLKTKGKNRGYVERSEVAAEIKGKQTVTVKIVRGNPIKD